MSPTSARIVSASTGPRPVIPANAPAMGSAAARSFTSASAACASVWIARYSRSRRRSCRSASGASCTWVSHASARGAYNRVPGGASAPTKAHVGPLASTAIACCGPTPRATNCAIPSVVRGKRRSHRRSPLGVTAHAWKNALCKSIPIYSRSMGCPPLPARSRACERPHYLRCHEWATALSFESELTESGVPCPAVGRRPTAAYGRHVDREALGSQVPLASYGTCETERLSIHAARSAAHRLAELAIQCVEGVCL